MKDKLRRIESGIRLGTAFILLAIAALGCSSPATPSATEVFADKNRPALVETATPDSCDYLPVRATARMQVNPLATLYAQKIPPGLVERCIPVIGVVNPGDYATMYDTSALMNGGIQLDLKENTTICFGTSASDVTDLCNQAGLNIDLSDDNLP